MKNRPRTVVTGAAGFIGRRVVARLAAEAEVVALDRVPDPGGWPAGVEYRPLDLDREMPGFKGNWMLVHLAWSLDRGHAEAQQESLRTFARLLGQAGLAGVVGLGSAEEYGELEGRLSEDMAPGLKLSAYGQAKHAACRALAAWAGKGGRKAAWLRPFVVYGPGQGGTMAIPYALRCARERTPADFSDGLQFRDFVHVDDVAAGIAAAALGLPGLKPEFAVCNLGRGKPVRLRDVLERIAKKTAAQDLFRFGARPMRPGEPQEQYAETSTAAGLFGWRAKISWEKGIDALCKEALR
ncbi:MAG: NAD-dependent epimerase/dehydratase family protein [Kiritimatiellia bacterium]